MSDEWLDETTVFIVKVDHVRVRIPCQPQQVGVAILLAYAPNQPRTSQRLCVVHVDEQVSVDVHEQNRVLNHRGYAQHPDACAQLHPSTVGQDVHLKAFFFELGVNSAAEVVGQENLFAAKPVDAVRVQVVGMAVRKPDVLCRKDVPLEVIGYAVGQGPTAKICLVLIAHPRVGGKHALLVVGKQNGVARGFHLQHR